MFYDVIIIGGGYWGQIIAKVLEYNSLTAIVLDDNDPRGASRNASGIVDPAAYLSPRFRGLLPPHWIKRIDASIEWLYSYVPGSWQQGSFHNQMSGTTKAAGRTFHVDYPFEIYKPMVERVEHIRLNPLVVNHKYTARWLCIAAGSHSDDVLHLAGIKPIGVKGLFGRGLVLSGKLGTLPYTVMTRPYTKYTFRQWAPDIIRLGDTAEIHPNGKRLVELVSLASQTVEGYQFVEEHQGYRPIMDKMTVKHVADRVVVATGGHRVGLGVAWLAAQDVLEIIWNGQNNRG